MLQIAKREIITQTDSCIIVIAYSVIFITDDDHIIRSTTQKT